jgi:ATP-dependent protease HslVU (ClpYQ) peptidase subunit
MGQILMDVPFPKQPKGMGDFKYMRTLFVDSIRKAFKDGGFGGSTSDDDSSSDTGGTFLVVYRDEIYCIENDFQVGLSSNRYHAIGCGGDFAMGAIEALERAKLHFSPEEFCREALSVAMHHSGGVREPFVIIEIPFKKSKNETRIHQRG